MEVASKSLSVYNEIVSFLKKYKSLILFALGFLLAFLLFKVPSVENFFLSLGSLGYLGALIGGIFFAYSFSVGFGVVILLTLAETMPHLLLALVAGFGTMLGDLLVFNLVRKNIKKKVTKFYRLLDRQSFLRRILDRKKFSWVLPTLGMIILASPFPDELGVAIIGESDMKESHFKIVSFLLNFLGIYILISILR